MEQIENFNNFAKGLKQKPQIGIHFDTGMNRTGLSKMDCEILSENFQSMTSNLDVILYVSHLHSSYNSKDISNKIQIDNFKVILFLSIFAPPKLFYLFIFNS